MRIGISTALLVSLSLYDVIRKLSAMGIDTVIHRLTTPMIEVAEDGETATGLWFASGKPVFMPVPDGPAAVMCHPYRTDSSQFLDARPPVPYRTFSETFEY